MNIYISGGVSPNIDSFDNHTIHYITCEEWLSKLKNHSHNDIIVWQYQYPWRNEKNSNTLNLEALDEWCVQQQVIIDAIKKEKKTVVLFNESYMSLSDVLNKTLKTTASDNDLNTTQNKNIDSDKLYLSLISVWGKKYWNTLEQLEKLSFTLSNIKQVRKNKFTTKPKEVLTYWLDFLSLTRQCYNENIELNKKLSLRFDELVKLTFMLEDVNGKVITEQQNNEKDRKINNKQKKSKIHSSQNDDYLERVNILNQEVANLKNEITLQREKNEEINNICAALSTEVEASKQSIKHRYSELAAITNMLETSSRAVMDLKEQLATANKKNMAIKNSLSWRATAPMRALSHPTKLKKNKKTKKIEEAINLIKNSSHFDPQWYLAQNQDVSESNIDPARHYLLFGGFEGRDPSTKFSSQGYLDLYKDVKESGMNPLEHYIRYGVIEDRTIISKIK
ncbi:hypothetical protein GBN32_02650 [Plesiomonas shigelloides]|uniref:hypothetical protein n=1 Tax=Plesiomonas shigelloides TaxID=703 RepID=UPI001262410A|nr:hypothetical protein [Plesiomonas shigelloides]KAB7714397.1 hypothetical protein GBN32_02650 [Plesiomonas shigelloides]